MTSCTGLINHRGPPPHLTWAPRWASTSLLTLLDTWGLPWAIHQIPGEKLTAVPKSPFYPQLIKKNWTGQSVRNSFEYHLYQSTSSSLFITILYRSKNVWGRRDGSRGKSSFYPSRNLLGFTKKRTGEGTSCSQRPVLINWAKTKRMVKGGDVYLKLSQTQQSLNSWKVPF